MSLPASFQLSVELTKLLPIRETAQAVAGPLLQQARELRRSGSDFVVEEDLVAVFGRGKIDPKLELHFRDLVNTTKFEYIYPGSDIRLHDGPGPTVRRALKEAYYLSMVIQLSFLGFTHERSSLASNLVDCFNERYRMGAPDSSPDANYEGISGFLRTCSSQTSQFPWELYVGLVEAHMPKSLALHKSKNPGKFDDLLRVLTPNLLLAAMDYLFIVQRFPDDRMMVVRNHAGVIPLIIWAHYVLGLTVLVKGTADGDITFGQSPRHQVIVAWSESMAGADAVDLLDSSMEVVLSTEMPKNNITRIYAEERIRLKGYNTNMVRRFCDEEVLFDLYAHVTLAFAIVVSSALYRVSIRTTASSIPLPQPLGHTEKWRLWEAADVLFDGISWTRKGVYADLKALQCQKLEDYLPQLIPIDYVQGSAALVKMLATVTLMCSKIADIRDCSDLPLAASHGLYSIVRDGIFEQLAQWDGKQYLRIREDDWINIACRLLARDEFQDEHRSRRKRMSLVSAWGWSIFLSNFNDDDPARTDCELLYVKRGVPTNCQTNEQKSRILDQVPMGLAPPDSTVVDVEDTYTPRCATLVSGRFDFYISKEREFWQTTRFDVSYNVSAPSSDQAMEAGSNIPYYASYRELHRALWACATTEACHHPYQQVTSAALHPRVVTIEGFQCPKQFPECDICVCLVKGNRRARWLVLSNIMDDCSGGEPYRNILLRTDECCENCATETARKYGGQWLVII